MAKIIPAKPRGKPCLAFLAFYRVLKDLPDDFTVWLSLADPVGDRPQVFVIWRERHAFLIQVAVTTQQLAESALQPDFFNQDNALQPDHLGRPESEMLDDFVVRASNLLGPLAGDLPLKRLVVFPNVNEGTIDEIVMLRERESATSYLGLRQIQASRFRRRLEALATAALPDPGLLHLRRVFTPESEVPDAFVARTNPDRNTSPNLPLRFLDFDQEWCVKNDLDLLPQQDAIVSESPATVRLVTGVAGSGKSLVLLYRALLSARLHPCAKVLVLTHNKPLRYELQRRSTQLAALPENLSCTTFFQWAAKSPGSWRDRMWWPSDVERKVARLKESSPALARFSTAFLVDEIGWIKDHRMLKKDLYLSSDRAGRSTSLRTGQREEIWNLFRAYRNTRSILRYACEFYENRRDPDENETDLNVPDELQLANITESGEPPQEIYLPTPQEEIARAANEALALRNHGLKPGRLLILHANSTLEQPLREALEHKLGNGHVHDAKCEKPPASAFCTVTTLNAATGLEAAVVFLLGMDHLLECEHDPRLSNDERRELRRDHTRMLYMGFTRAGQRLVIFRSPRTR